MMTTKLKWAMCLTISTILCSSAAIAQEETPDRLREEVQQKVERLEAELARRDAADARTLRSNFNNQANRTLIVPQFPQSAQDPFAIAEPNTRWSVGQSANLTTHFSPFGRRDPKLAEAYNEANKQLGELVKKIKTTESEEVKLELKEEVKALLEQKYDAYLQHHEAPLIQLEERLEKLRAEFESRKNAKDDLVKLRLDTIWYDAIGLGWPENKRSVDIFGQRNDWRTPTVSVPANPAIAPTALLPPNRSARPAESREPRRTSSGR